MRLSATSWLLNIGLSITLQTVLAVDAHLAEGWRLFRKAAVNR
jgi:hypothetical protein